MTEESLERAEKRITSAKGQVAFDVFLFVVCIGIVGAAAYLMDVNTWASIVVALIGVIGLWVIGLVVLPEDRRRLDAAKDDLWELRWEERR